MKKEIISDIQGISLIILFMTGTSSILVMGIDAQQDAWLAVIIGIFMVLVISLIYIRLNYLFPDKDLFDIIFFCFGNFIGKIICTLFTWYAYHTSIMVTLSISQFIVTTNLVETPHTLVTIGVMLLCIWGVKEGLEVLGKISQFFLNLYIFLIASMILLLIPEMDIARILPILNQGFIPILKGAFFTFSFPLGEGVVFSMVFSQFKTKKSSIKIYWWGLAIGGVIIILISLMNILVIGSGNILSSYYPTYNTASRVRFLYFVPSLTIILTMVFIIGGFIKVSIYLMAISKGISKIFGIYNYRSIVTCSALHIINLTIYLYDSLMAMVEWNLEIWPYYAIPFQILLPMLILILSEIKNKHKSISS